jgi:hypothetical protein
MAVQVPPHTAISSCSGYIYQGKVALLHCMKLFENIGVDARVLKLEIESLDDFAIKNSDDSYRSMHQVKAKKNQRFSSYQVAINQQMNSAQNHPGIQVYFHVAKSITDIPDGFQATYSPVKFYNYKNEHNVSIDSCELDRIDAWNNLQIKRTFQALGEPAYKSSDESYLSRTRHILEDMIIKHIILVHHKIIECKNPAITDRHIASASEIPLEHFYQVLAVQNLNQVINEDYFHWFLIKRAGEYFHEYCLELMGSEDSVVEDNNLCKLNYYLSIINTLDISGLKGFIQLIMPHRKASFRTIQELTDNTFNRDDFKFGLLTVLHELTKSENNHQNTELPLFYWNKGEQVYFPTAIEKVLRHEKVICQEIINTSLDSDVDFLFEAGRLVNQAITNNSVFAVAANGFFFENEEEDPYKHQKFNSVKNISLISLNDAKEIINE